MGKEKGAMPYKITSRKQIGVNQKEMGRASEKAEAKEKGKLLMKNIIKSSDRNAERSAKSIEKKFQKKQNHKNEKYDQGKKGKKNESICPIVKKCGGCQLLHQSYEQQLKDKQKLVDGLLSKFCKVDKIIGMDNPYHYRNKVHAVFDHDRKGNPISGVYEAGTHRVVPVENCLIENKKADEIISSIRGLLKSFKIKTYDEDTGYGLLRHVLVRIGYTSGEIMVVLVLGSPIMPSKNNFVKALRKLHPEITTIIINVNNKKTSMVLGEKEQVIYGKGYIEDTLCGKVFRISPKSFYQVNPVQTEVLYNKAIEYAEFTGNETIIDAYCGIGTIGIIASEYVKKIIGVEMNKDAVRDAVLNAKRNNISNIDFYNKDAGEFMSQMAAQNQTVDFVFMDPPRAGSDEKFLSSLCSLNPKKVVYISCNPVTLERDLMFLTKKGYKVQKAVPVDMFPGTTHVECVILMQRCGSGNGK
nr:23S rRNA (uracil(1939)-C(5))-methyltransferase RlmD [uncultured Anaerocolumna sp.]